MAKKKNPTRRKRVGPASRGLAAQESASDDVPVVVEELSARITDAGGALASHYRDPLGGSWLALAALPVAAVEVRVRFRPRAGGRLPRHAGLRLRGSAPLRRGRLRAGNERLKALLRQARLALPPGARLEIEGADPLLASRFPIGEAAAVAIGLGAAAAARLWELRGGASQIARVDVRAAAASLLGFVLQHVPDQDLTRLRNAVTELYPTGDGRWIHLHGGFPRLAEGTLELLGCEMDAASIRRALEKWDAPTLEEALAERGLCGAMVRTTDEWASPCPGARPVRGARGRARAAG